MNKNNINEYVRNLFVGGNMLPQALCVRLFWGYNGFQILLLHAVIFLFRCLFVEFIFRRFLFYDNLNFENDRAQFVSMCHSHFWFLKATVHFFCFFTIFIFPMGFALKSLLFLRNHDFCFESMTFCYRSHGWTRNLLETSIESFYSPNSVS